MYKDMFEAFVLISWAAALWGIASTLIHSKAEFAAIGKSKTRWVWIELAGLIPYTGFIMAVIYSRRVRRRFPRTVRQVQRTSGSYGPSNGSSGPGYQQVASQPTETHECGFCRDGKIRCPTCQNNWEIRRQRHCCNTGWIDCYQCQGTGRSSG